MKRKVHTGIMLCGALLSWVLLAGIPGNIFGQEPQKPSVPPHESGEHIARREADRQEQREHLLAKIEGIKYEKIKKALSLDDKTAEAFFAIYKPAEKDVQSIVRQRNEELKKITLMMDDAKSDAEVDPEMQRFHNLNKQIQDRELKVEEDLKPILSAQQRARLLVFEHEFNARVQEMVVKNRLQEVSSDPKQPHHPFHDRPFESDSLKGNAPMPTPNRP